MNGDNNCSKSPASEIGARPPSTLRRVQLAPEVRQAGAILRVPNGRQRRLPSRTGSDCCGIYILVLRGGVGDHGISPATWVERSSPGWWSDAAGAVFLTHCQIFIVCKIFARCLEVRTVSEDDLSIVLPATCRWTMQRWSLSKAATNSIRFWRPCKLISVMYVDKCPYSLADACTTGDRSGWTVATSSAVSNYVCMLETHKTGEQLILSPGTLTSVWLWLVPSITSDVRFVSSVMLVLDFQLKR